MTLWRRGTVVLDFSASSRNFSQRVRMRVFSSRSAR